MIYGAVVATTPGLIWERDPAGIALRKPVLIVALSGWFDMARTATDAAEWLSEKGNGERVARLDGEVFTDYSARRPMATFDEGGLRKLVWPDTTVETVTTEETRDLIVVRGHEPDYRWRTFVDALLDVARTLGAEFVLTVGASGAEVPHTRPQPLTTSASSLELARRLGLGTPSYQGITGVVGVLQERLGRESIPGISVRAGIPPYLGEGPNPAGTQVLLRRIAELTGVDTKHADLASAVAEWETQVDVAVNADEDMRNLVTELERRYQKWSTMTVEPDRLLNDLERYLRGDEA